MKLREQPWWNKSHPSNPVLLHLLLHRCNMAQSRLLSLMAKVALMEHDVKEMEKNLQSLRQLIGIMKKKQFGRHADVAVNKIEPRHLMALLQSSHKVDNLILGLQHLLNRCRTHSAFLQRQLELRKV